ncbi:MAG TPA: hypothetical protein VFW40_13590 [Capsulimonadaceae bacterium]|nr:hypothetical protein [Capsulimonadaceae bacterium]
MQVSRPLSLVLLVLALCVPAYAQKWTTVYNHSGPLAHYALTLEANPGINGPYPTTPDMSDVSMKTVTAGGAMCTELIANTKPRNIYANVLAFYKLNGKTPDGKPIQLTTYRYQFAVRLEHVPVARQAPYNAQSVEMSLQFWDGSNTLWHADKRQVEATIYWDLNPWSKSFGEIMVYTNAANGGLKLYDTGIHLTPDTNWHTFALSADLARRVWSGITIDQRTNPLPNLPLLLRKHEDWGGGMAIALTAESMNCYPGPKASYVNQCTTDFKDVKLSRVAP